MVKEKGFFSISIRKKCLLLKVPKSSVYYTPVQEKEENLKLMDLIEKRYLEDPPYGARRIRAYLDKKHGIKVNLKRVKGFMRKMCIKRDISSS